MSASFDVHDAQLYSVLDTVVISSEDVCCSVIWHSCWEPDYTS